MNFPKQPRIKDKKGINKVKAIGYCERCKRVADGFYNLEVAHVVGKGAWGPDIKENLIKLCGPASMARGCHGLDHKGKITEDELFELIAYREGRTLEEIKGIVHRAWRFGEYEIN